MHVLPKVQFPIGRVTIEDLEPPIPGGPFWQAYFDNDPSTGFVGSGDTAEKAIADLKFQWEEERDYV